MAAPYTLTLREAETRLRDLVKQAQATRQPVVLITEETAEPVAVLVESGIYEALQRREQQLFHLRRQLFQHLDSVEQRSKSSVPRQNAPNKTGWKGTWRTLHLACARSPTFGWNISAPLSPCCPP